MASVKTATGSALPAELRVTLARLVDRIVPRDGNGPGGSELGLDAYIDSMLADRRPELLDRYVDALSATEDWSRELRGLPFAELANDDADLLVGRMADHPSALPGSAFPFFALLHQHLIEGLVGDPIHGGNRDAMGWRLIGYPGPRLTVTAAEQEIDHIADDSLRSAFDLEPFRR